MCSRFESANDRVTLRRDFLVNMPSEAVETDVWPGYHAVAVRTRSPNEGHTATPSAPKAVSARFGLIPPWARDATIARHTYNARSETVASKPSFQQAWAQAQHAIIPVRALYEPDWRSGRAVAARIEHADGQAMGIAALWSAWQDPHGRPTLSFTLLTIEAGTHLLMRQLHKPDDEKRMVVILPPEHYQAWLHAKADESMHFMRAFPADQLHLNVPPSAQGSLF